MGTCRLCLKSLCGSPVIALESSMRTSINFVLPEINLDISTTPAVCKACCDIIQSLYQFKVNCIEIEEKIRAKTSGGYVKLNLKEIFSNLLTKKKEERLCRTCLCSIDCQSFTVLQPSEPDPYLDSMLIMCLPELDMELCRDPVMCQKCLDSLQKLYNLKTTCLEVEEKLKNYHFAQGTNIDAQINLQEAMESFSNETGLVNIKKEAEIDLVDEKYPDDATQAIKEEEIDIKEESIADKEPKVLRSVKCNKNLTDEDFRCEVCGKYFTTTWNLGRHKQIHTGEKKFECKRCHTRYGQKSVLEQHIRSKHTGEKPFKCKSCPKAFAGKSDLACHMKAHQGIRPYTCGHCGHQFTQKSNLKKHIKGHSGEKAFRCEVCYKMFATKHNLQSHMNIHNDNKPYYCDICDEGFRHSTPLKIHMMIHRGKNPFTCETCGKLFLNESGLRTHKKTHLGDKPFPCPICGKKFVKESIVISHLTIHTGKKLFECFLCARKYADKSKLNYHLKTRCLKSDGMSIKAC